VIIQESLIERVEGYLTQLRNSKKYEDLYFKLIKSKTTKSFYIKVLTKAGDEMVCKILRISDHHNSKFETKVISKNMNFTTIKRRIISTLQKTRVKRLNMLMRKEIKK
jgi:hypothetical protein